MIKIKYTNQEHTQVQISDNETGYNKSGPLHRLKKEIGDDEIEQFETEQEIQDNIKKERQKFRDEIINSAVIEYQGNYIDMSPSAVGFMSYSYGSFERGKGVNWKVQDKNTSDKKRINLKKQDIDKITDALFDAIQIIHETADIESPVSPWPLLVE